MVRWKIIDKRDSHRLPRPKATIRCSESFRNLVIKQPDDAERPVVANTVYHRAAFLKRDMKKIRLDAPEDHQSRRRSFLGNVGYGITS